MATLRKRKKKRGGSVYILDFRYQGKRIQRSTKTDDYKTAKLIQKDIEARIAKGAFNLEDIEEKKSVFLKDFIQEFLQYSKTHKAEKTWIRDRLVFKGFLRFCGNRSLSSIDKKLIDQFMGERVKRLSRSTINIDLRHIKAALTKAVEWGYIDKNPAKGIKPLSIPQRAPNYFTEIQIEKIISVIDYKPLKEIVIFAVNTGVRIGELVNIKWSHVDFNNKTVRISQKDGFETKSKRERTIPMNKKVYELLLSKERKGEYVFCRNDGLQREEHFIARKFKKYLYSVDLGDGFSFHSLRHTFASHLAQKGVSLFIVSRLLGHANFKTTEIYAHLAPQTFHDVVRLLDGKDGESSPFYGVVGE